MSLTEAQYRATPPTLTDGQLSLLRVDSAGALVTTGGGGGMVAIDQTTPGTTNGIVATGNVASGAADSGNPVKAGGVFNTTPATLTTGQRGDLQLSSKGLLRVVLGDGSGGTTNLSTIINSAQDSLLNGQNGVVTFGLNSFYNGSTWDRQRGDANGAVIQAGLSSTFWNYAAATGGIVNTTTAVTIKAAAGASVRNYLKTLTIAHDTLGGATELAIRDGAAGTVLWRGKLQTAAIDSCQAASIEFDPPLKGTANTLMEVVTLTAVTGGVFVCATGFTGI